MKSPIKDPATRREIGVLLWKYECHLAKLQKKIDKWEGKPIQKLEVLVEFMETKGKIKALEWILREGDGD